ncbi:hypothetical protein [Microbacterium jejuense]|uniref:hypothetical protein n=1 Tax=Microbacterium jejuense TaxID=1263637 RepID=UPI0031EEF6C8
MAHTDKDQPYKYTGQWNHRYWTTPRGHSKFTRACRQAVRAAAKAALRVGREPEPRHPAEHWYWD